jgi:hypothetical protein
MSLLFMLMSITVTYYTCFETSDSAGTDKQDTNSSIQSQTASYTQERGTVNPQVIVDDPNRTTSRLVGNGLAYFVFWFVGAPILIFVAFIFFFMAGLITKGVGWVLFLVFLVVTFIAFVFHTFQIINSGFNASVAPDEPTAKTAFISQQIPQMHSGEERIACPMCAEKILPQAKICHFCKSVLTPPEGD